MTCREAARRLGLHPRTVWRMCEDGDLPAFRLTEHGHWRLSRATVEKIVSGPPVHERVPE